ncbi:MAG: hypothetical protein OEW02_07550 [Myxococcales bacterium]|nr:hypothetical protein [Myxococcales bacterium]MDH5567173.1 hypothetical protein [Myxococcales bacterium]
MRIGLEFSVLLSVSLALSVAQKDRTAPGRITFVLLALASMAWSSGELLLLRGVVGEFASDQIRYAGMLALPGLWLGFAAHVAGLEVARRVPWFSAIFLFPGACLYPLLYSTCWGTLFVELLPGGRAHHGPLWTFWALYAQLLAATGSLLLVAAAIRAPHHRQAIKRVMLALAPLLPLAGSILHGQAGTWWPADPTPLLLGVALLALRSVIFSGGVLQPLPISQRDLLHQLPFGVILTDRFGTVVEINDVARDRLNTTERGVLGRSLGNVLAATGVAPLHSAPLRHWGRSAGEIVLV